ncbi:MAG: site-specific integrase [Clostridia bacterium]|nr:site-specific integrase [Clostridia bacterium]
MATPIKTPNGTWRIRVGWTDENGVKQVKCKSGFPTANKAILWAEDFKNRVSISGMDGSVVRLAELRNLTYENKKMRGNAERTLADFLKYSNYIMKHFKNPLIDDIKPLQIESVLKVYADRPGLCGHIRDAFSVMFSFAFKKGITDENIFLRVEMPVLAKKKVLPCKEEDYNRLLKIIKAECPIYYPAILLGGVCGLRPGEALALTEDNVTPQYVKVCASVSYLSAKENELLGNDLQNSETVKAPKSHAGNRIIPITPEFYEELHYAKNLYKIKSEWICCNILGDRLDYLATGRQVRRTLKRHGIENFSLYQMRHFFGNANKRNGVDRFTTATLMGHSDASVTERYYYSEDKILSKKATNKIIDSFFKAQSSDN